MSSPVDLAYMAGFVDGEGCINITKNHEVHFQIANTNKAVLHWIRGHFGGTIHSKKLAKEHWSPAWTWCASGTCAVGTLRKLLPFLIVKENQALLAIKFWEDRVDLRQKPLSVKKLERDRREKYRLAISNLNQGVPTHGA